MTTFYCTFKTLYGRPGKAGRPGETYNSMTVSTNRTVGIETVEAETIADLDRIIAERKIEYVWFASSNMPRNEVTVEVARERKLFAKFIRTWTQPRKLTRRTSAQGSQRKPDHDVSSVEILL